jgi:hypothetical protein
MLQSNIWSILVLFLLAFPLPLYGMGKTCPKDVDEWKILTQNAAKNIIQIENMDGNSSPFLGKVLATHYYGTHKPTQFRPFARDDLKAFNELLESCRIGGTVEILECTKNLSSFASFAARPSSHGLGHTVSDLAYFEDKHVKKAMKLPVELTNSDFLRSLEPLTLEKPKELNQFVKRLNSSLDQALVKTGRMQSVSVFPFKTQSVDTVPPEPPSQGRLVVQLISPDQTVQTVMFVISDQKRPILHRQISIVTRMNAGQDPKDFILDLVRVSDQSNHIKIVPRPKLVESGAYPPSPETCYHCHKSGFIEIHGDPNSRLTHVYADAIQNANGRGASPRFNPYLKDPAPGGPIFGPKKARSRQFMSLCTGGVQNSEALARIEKAMNCQKCHDVGKSRGPLSYPIARMLSGKNLFEHYITINSETPMPPDNKLNSKERKLLYQCLKKEYHDSLEKWIYDQECFDRESIFDFGNAEYPCH